MLPLGCLSQVLGEHQADQDLQGICGAMGRVYVSGGPPPCNSGILGLYEDPNILTIFP